MPSAVACSKPHINLFNPPSPKKTPRNLKFVLFIAASLASRIVSGTS